MLSAVQVAERAYTDQGLGVQLLPFFYCVEFLGIPNAPYTATQIIDTDRDSDFFWWDTRAVYMSAAGANLIRARLSIVVQVSATGRALTQSSPTSIYPGVFTTTMAGLSAARPFIHFEPILIPARSALIVTVSPQAAYGTASCYLAFGGMKAVQVRP